jgi:hypothetical protein
LCRIGPNNRREHVLAKLHNPEPTMPQWKVTLATTKKKTKKTFLQKRKKIHFFKQGHSMTLATASVIRAAFKKSCT